MSNRVLLTLFLLLIGGAWLFGSGFEAADAPETATVAPGQPDAGAPRGAAARAEAQPNSLWTVVGLTALIAGLILIGLQAWDLIHGTIHQALFGKQELANARHRLKRDYPLKSTPPHDGDSE